MLLVTYMYIPKVHRSLYFQHIIVVAALHGRRNYYVHEHTAPKISKQHCKQHSSLRFRGHHARGQLGTNGYSSIIERFSTCIYMYMYLVLVPTVHCFSLHETL